jgi:hypothetical protein
VVSENRPAARASYFDILSLQLQVASRCSLIRLSNQITAPNHSDPVRPVRVALVHATVQQNAQPAAAHVTNLDHHCTSAVLTG